MAVNDPLYAARVRSILQTRGFFNVTPPGVIVQDVNGVVTIARWDPQYGAQPTDAQVIAVTDVAAAAAVTADAQRATQIIIDAMPIFEKAIILTLIDETNRLRAALRGLGVAGLPDVSVQTALAAVRTKAGTL